MTELTDDTFVYVNPNAHAVVGPVEWLPNGDAKRVPLPMAAPAPAKEEKPDRPHRPRKPREQLCPWCSYKTAKKIYRVAGKEREAQRSQPFDEALSKALVEPYWD